MLQVPYKTKKVLKEQVGRNLEYKETVAEWFEPDYKSNGLVWVTNDRRSYFAKVTMRNDLIIKVQ